ncbi:MAG TPA: site-specific DNA-methyltransferase, partial [Flavobacteriaceae bacterium]|nr:site-specific DNA-methyltransferase [Flavobacteriaceae bacterium]
DYEIAQSKLILDEIFNYSNNPKESNSLGVLIWNLGTGTQAGHFVRSHEYVLAYCKNKSQLKNFSGGEGFIEHSALKKISRKNPAS